MTVTDTYSSQVRERLAPEDWAAIRAAGPGEVRFGRGYRGIFTCAVVVQGGMGIGNDLRSPRAAWDKAMRDLRAELPGIDSLLGGAA